MFDDFAYRNYQVRAGVRQRGADGVGKWYGVISLVSESEQCILSLPDHLFDWPAAARRHAIGYARALIDSRLDGAPDRLNASSSNADRIANANRTEI